MVIYADRSPKPTDAYLMITMETLRQYMEFFLPSCRIQIIKAKSINHFIIWLERLTDPPVAEMRCYMRGKLCI